MQEELTLGSFVGATEPFHQDPLRIRYPHPPTPEFLSKDVCLQPGQWKFLLRRTWSDQKLLPLQFPGLSLPYQGNQVSLVRILVTQHCDPPLSHYKVWLYLSHLRFLGIAGYHAIPPLLGVSQKYVEGGGGRGVLGGFLGGGYRRSMLPSPL